MAFVPPYMGQKTDDPKTDVNILSVQQSPEYLEQHHQKDLLKEIVELCDMPLTKKSEVIWDISVMIISQKRLQRITSANHGITIETDEKQMKAKVTLNEEVKKYVPHKDFVLLIKDEGINDPVGLKKKGVDGSQAISISVMPDMMSAKDRLAAIQASKVNGQGIDSDP